MERRRWRAQDEQELLLVEEAFLANQFCYVTDQVKKEVGVVGKKKEQPVELSRMPRYRTYPHRLWFVGYDTETPGIVIASVSNIRMIMSAEEARLLAHQFEWAAEKAEEFKREVE